MGDYDLTGAGLLCMTKRKVEGGWLHNNVTSLNYTIKTN